MRIYIHVYMYQCLAEIHQNPINLSFKHFHFGSLRCAAFALNGNPYKGPRVQKKKKKKNWENGKTKGAGVAVRRKIRSKAQIFARINGDDDRWKTKRQEEQKKKM